MKLNPKPITPTLDPRNIKGDLPATRSTRDAFARAHARITKLHKAEDALLRDRTLTETARSAQLHELRTKVTSEVQPVYERAYAQVGEALEGVERKINERLYSTEHKTASREEIRQHVASLPQERRSLFVRDRARAGDMQTVAAVLTAPSYLSGLGDDGQRVLRDLITKDVAPDLAREHRELRETSQRLERAAKALKHHYVDPRPHKGAEAARTRAEAVAAATEAV